MGDGGGAGSGADMGGFGVGDPGMAPGGMEGPNERGGWSWGGGLLGGTIGGVFGPYGTAAGTLLGGTFGDKVSGFLSDTSNWGTPDRPSRISGQHGIDRHEIGVFGEISDKERKKLIDIYGDNLDDVIDRWTRGIGNPNYSTPADERGNDFNHAIYRGQPMGSHGPLAPGEDWKPWKVSPEWREKKQDAKREKRQQDTSLIREQARRDIRHVIDPVNLAQESLVTPTPTSEPYTPPFPFNGGK